MAATATSSGDAGASRLREAESSNGDLGSLEVTSVIGNGTNNNGDILLVLAGHKLSEAGDRDGRSVDTGHGQTLENDGVEGGLSAAGQELVELDSEAEIGILADGVLTNVLADVLGAEIDTHGYMFLF